MAERYDVAVIGAGPAGLAAALNAAIRKKKVIVFGPEMSEKLHRTEHIANYLGLPDVTGAAMMTAFRQHVESYEVTFRSDRVQVVYDMGASIGLLLAHNEIVSARTAVLAMGVNFGTPLPGEAELLGHGVGYCATCDAALYKNRTVVVIGYNDESMEEARFIAEVARETTFVNQTGRAVDLGADIRVVQEKPQRILGEEEAQGVALASGILEADGVFIIRDARKADQLAPGIQMDGAHVVVDANMATSLPNIFACGDLVGQPYQINAAVGRGQIAGLSAAKAATRQEAEERKASAAGN